MDVKYILALVIAFAISYLATPQVIKLAYKIGAIDIPKDERRVHTKPIPRIGGVAIVLAFTIVYLLFNNMPMFKALGFISGLLLIFLTGLVDDLKNISAKTKLVGQIGAAVIMFMSGFRIDFLTNYFQGTEEIIYMGMLSFPITIFWIVGITNTVNLIDGLDGLAAGISTIAAVCLSYVAITNGRYDTAIITLALVGACLGFLPYNFNPAKIFMGDTGALSLGFILSVTAIDGSIKGATFLVFAAPILALGLPIFDTAFAILRRLVNGRPIMEADKGHLHHRLLYLGFNQRYAVLTMYLISALLGLGGIFLIQAKYVSMLVTLLLACILICTPIAKAMKKERVNDSKGE